MVGDGKSSRTFHGRALIASLRLDIRLHMTAISLYRTQILTV